MKKRSVTPAYPNHEFEDAMRAAGAQVRVMWEMQGPEHTMIAWMVCYTVGFTPVIVHTYTEDNGWNIFYPSGYVDTKKTIDEAIKRCGVVLQPAAPE